MTASRAQLPATRLPEPSPPTDHQWLLSPPPPRIPGEALGLVMMAEDARSHTRLHYPLYTQWQQSSAMQLGPEWLPECSTMAAMSGVATGIICHSSGAERDSQSALQLQLSPEPPLVSVVTMAGFWHPPLPPLGKQPGPE